MIEGSADEYEKGLHAFADENYTAAVKQAEKSEEKKDYEDAYSWAAQALSVAA